MVCDLFLVDVAQAQPKGLKLTPSARQWGTFMWDELYKKMLALEATDPNLAQCSYSPLPRLIKQANI